VRKSALVGPAQGKGRLTKAEAQRKAVEIIEKAGVNTPEHLARAMNAEAETLRARVAWCRINHPAWTEGKRGPIETMESMLRNHILPALGDLPVHALDERVMAEFMASLKRKQLERRRKDGSVLKTYTLSKKTRLNILGVVKTVVGRKVYQNWELRLGRSPRPQQRYFREEELTKIIQAAQGQYKVIFAVLTTGMRIGEALGLHVEDVDVNERIITIRRSVYRGAETTPKTENAVRQIDISQALADILKAFIGERTEGLLFRSRRGGPLSDTNIRNRVLKPILRKLGLAHGGLHSFRHGVVTLHRKAGTPENLVRLWIGHSTLGNITDRYSHTDQEIEYRRSSVLSLDRIIKAG
jgi:integrase